MQIQSVRDLKQEIAAEVFAPLVNNLLDRARNPALGARIAALPQQLLAIGVALGSTPGEFMLAVRLQTQSALLQNLVERLRVRAGGEIDVRFVGRVSAQGADSSADLRKVRRPLVIGCSLAHIASTAGTLGLIARHRKTGSKVLLSNVHVLAQAGAAKLGDAISQPGPLDGGNSGDHVAALLDFVPLKLDGSNQVDAAIAVVDNAINLVPNALPGLGAFTVPGGDIAMPGMKVMKLGRTTGLTHGAITATEVDHIAVDYDVGTATFDDQIEIAGLPNQPFSDGGDSGSLVLDENMHALAMVFCGNPAANDGAGVSYANHLPKIMAAVGIDSL
jgi:hypothetical protein